MLPEQLALNDPDQIAASRSWWQRTWAQLPRWAKIGLIAIALSFFIHVGIAFRVWYGLRDPAEVAAIKGPGRHIIIPATNKLFVNPLEWLEAVPAGLKGVSAADVTAVRLEEQATDELVAHIGKFFPNVQSLYLMRGKISARGLLALKNCQQITSLDISDTDVGDDLNELLPHLPLLTSLLVMNTNLSGDFARPRRTTNDWNTAVLTARTSHRLTSLPGKQLDRKSAFKRILLESFFAA